MPELPEAESARRMLQRLLKGKRIVRGRAVDPIVFAGTHRRARGGGARGRTVRGSGRKGKHIWLELDRRPWPAFHMGMSGWFEVYDTDDGAAAASGSSSCSRADGVSRSATSGASAACGCMQDPAGEPPISELGFDPLVGCRQTAELARHLARRSAPIKAGPARPVAVRRRRQLDRGRGALPVGHQPAPPGARPLDRDEVARLRRVLHAIVAWR